MLIRKRPTTLTSPSATANGGGHRTPSSWLVISPKQRTSSVCEDDKETDRRPVISPRAIAYGEVDDDEIDHRPLHSPPPSPRAKCAPLRLRETVGLMIAMVAVSLSVWLLSRDMFVQDIFFQLSPFTSSGRSSPLQEDLPAADVQQERSVELAPKKEFIFLAFYYPWYVSDDWSQHGTQGHSPLLGHYGSDQVEIAERHIEMAVRGGIDAWAVSWWDRNTKPAHNFMDAMLKAKNIDQIKFTMVYESKGALPVDGDFGNGTEAMDKFVSDMVFFRETYFDHPSYLRINGRPVVYVYLTRYWKNFQASMLAQVKKAVGQDILIIADNPYYEINGAPDTAFNGLKENGKPIFEAYTSYNMYTFPRVRDGESATDYMFREALPVYERWSNRTVFFPHVLPKYHDFRDGHRELTGDTKGLTRQLEAFACLPRPKWYEDEFPNLMFVTSFNEWWEGTAIEPDVKDEYGYSLLDTIRSFKDKGVRCDGENELESVQQA